MASVAAALGVVVEVVAVAAEVATDRAAKANEEWSGVVA